MSILEVTIVQADLAWHDPETNRSTLGNILTGLENPGDLVVLPEMFTTGFTMDARSRAESMNGPSVAWMAEWADRTGAALAGSLVIEEAGHCYNRFILMHPDGRVEHYDKRHLFRLAGEHEHYSAGHGSPVFGLKGWRIRPLVCYDLRFPVWSRNRGDYDLLVCVANWPKPRHLAWETLARARAIENLAFVVATNRVGVDGSGVAYEGGSAIIDYSGRYLSTLSGEAGTATAQLDMSELETFRSRFPFHLDADSFDLGGVVPGGSG